MEPLLPWVGGKTWLVRNLRNLWATLPVGTRLVEPFAGSLSLTFSLLPKRALLNDINHHLINFYQQVMDGLELPPPVPLGPSAFDSARRAFNRLVAADLWRGPRAARLYFALQQNAYSRMSRFNTDGEFNAGRRESRTEALSYPSNGHLEKYRDVMKMWEFRCGDFQSITATSGDLIYADPPYDGGQPYWAGGFSWEQQTLLAQWSSRAADLGLPVVVSNSATDRMVDLYRNLGFEVSCFPVHYRLRPHGKRPAHRELLAVRNVGFLL